MSTEIVLIDSILCFLFVLYNYKNKHKRILLLPSTIFGLVWGISTLGGYLYSIDFFNESVINDIYYKVNAISEIGYYQLFLLITIFIAFICAHRFTIQNKSTEDFSLSDGITDLTSISSIFKIFLYLYFIVGMVRLIIVLSAVGLNYSAIRILYVNTRQTFSTFDLQLIRIGSYLMQISVIYVALLGIQSAIYGISIKRVFSCFLLFCPFQLSFGGRLFILSFFVPFLLSYFIIYALNGMKYSNLSDRKKIRLLALLGAFLVIGIQILKQGKSIGLNSIIEYSTEIFYNSTSYIYMGQLWTYLQDSFDLQFGLNLFTGTSPIIEKAMELWNSTENSARFCVPSMIPGIYVDFGFWGSLPVYFLIFYNIERIGLKKLSNLSLNNILVYLCLCIFCFNTAASSMFDCMKTLVISLILIHFVPRLIKPIKI